MRFERIYPASLDFSIHRRQTVGSFDLESRVDQAFPFDGDSSGNEDHIVFYRPGTGAISIVKLINNEFVSIYNRSQPGNGIGSFDLLSGLDRGFAFDFNSSGKNDHLFFYRPSSGAFSIIKKNGNDFVSVVHENDPGRGLGSFDILSDKDRAFPFDYSNNGKLDHIVFYRPGSGAISIIRCINGQNIESVFNKIDPGPGIGRFDLSRTNDKGLCFDNSSIGSMNHLVFFRPGSGAISVMRREGNDFISEYNQIEPGNGIGGFDLHSPFDDCFAFDFDGTGKKDHLVFFRQATNTMFIVKFQNGNYVNVYNQNIPSNNDILFGGSTIGFAFDFERTGKCDHLAFYDSFVGLFRIFKKV